MKAIGIYMRLSLSDAEIRKKKANNEETDESNSIENQRILMRKYIEAHPELDGEVIEYVDAPVIIGLKNQRLKKC